MRQNTPSSKSFLIPAPNRWCTCQTSFTGGGVSRKATAGSHKQNFVQFPLIRLLSTFQLVSKHSWLRWWGWGWLAMGPWAGNIWKCGYWSCSWQEDPWSFNTVSLAGTLQRRWRKGKALSWSGFGTAALWRTCLTISSLMISASVTRVTLTSLSKLLIPMSQESLEQGSLRWESQCCSFYQISVIEVADFMIGSPAALAEPTLERVLRSAWTSLATFWFFWGRRRRSTPCTCPPGPCGAERTSGKFSKLWKVWKVSKF